MKKIINPQVGDLCEVPAIQFAPMRSGWNGWIFRVGIIDKLYISKTGRKCASVRYCSNTAGRYELLPCTEVTRNYVIENVFQYNGLDRARTWYNEGREAEKDGKQVCWDQDTALLVNNGFIN